MYRTPFKVATDGRSLAVYLIAIVAIVAAVSAVPGEDPPECSSGQMAGSQGATTYCVKGE
jgi:hypothetical protein